VARDPFQELPEPPRLVVEPVQDDVLDADPRQLYYGLHARRRQGRVHDHRHRRELPNQLLKLGDLELPVGRRVDDQQVDDLRVEDPGEVSPPLGGVKLMPAAEDDPQVREELRGEKRRDVHDLPGPVS
jgi:hypothetical protein